MSQKWQIHVINTYDRHKWQIYTWQTQLTNIRYNTRDQEHWAKNGNRSVSEGGGGLEVVTNTRDKKTHDKRTGRKYVESAHGKHG
jgi:hypothetical protein